MRLCFVQICKGLSFTVYTYNSICWISKTYKLETPSSFRKAQNGFCCLILQHTSHHNSTKGDKLKIP
ncbi:hypothetical protein AQUCO_02700076v1 [Aquilegia coerulea]|uniref:Uncharacterized protein n=1 Tax=Aquilegia coerulea TaxID=218851 RepID=A0A2G5D511_AQUCA|nr:hypothetical protein AQUCO_02700076v1 [Aquilegia coerulea]